MNRDDPRIEELKSGLEAAIRAEEELESLLSRQEQALQQGSSDGILEASTALEPAYDALRAAMETCHIAVREIDVALGLAQDTPLRHVLKALPDELAPPLVERREHLVSVRRRARRKSVRNATLARASLDAIRTVRDILSGEGEPTVAAGAAGRLDAQA